MCNPCTWEFEYELEVSISYMVRTPSPQPLSLYFGFSRLVCLCSPGCAGTLFVDHASFELRHPPAGNEGVCHQIKPGHWRDRWLSG